MPDMEKPVEFLVLLLSILMFKGGDSAPIPPGCFPKIYAFGDSLTDTGNTKSGEGPANFQGVSRPPYGETYFHRPTNRYSDGRLVIDFIAQALGLPLLPPYMNGKGDFGQGVNYAVAGSTALDHDFFAQKNMSFDQTPQSLGTQLLWHNRLMDSVCHNATSSRVCKYKASAEALYWVGEIGANDYTYALGSNVSNEMIRTLTIDKKLRALEALIQVGARYIVVQGIPLTGCLTMTLALFSGEAQDQFGCIKSANDEAVLHNSLLQRRLAELRQKYPIALIVYADYYGAHRKIMENPSAYGFRNSLSACCGAGGGTYNFDLFATCGEDTASLISGRKAASCADPGKYMNWDGIHFTEAVNNVVANMFLEGGFTRPAFNALFAKKRC